jgi:hypothetical protein
MTGKKTGMINAGSRKNDEYHHFFRLAASQRETRRFQVDELQPDRQ